MPISIVVNHVKELLQLLLVRHAFQGINKVQLGFEGGLLEFQFFAFLLDIGTHGIGVVGLVSLIF